MSNSTRKPAPLSASSGSPKTTVRPRTAPKVMSLISGVTCHTRRASTPCTSSSRKAKSRATTFICVKTWAKIGPTSSGWRMRKASPSSPVRWATSSSRSSFQSVPNPRATSGTPAAATRSASLRHSSSRVVWPSVNTISRLATRGDRFLAISASPARMAGAIVVPPPASSRATRSSRAALLSADVAGMSTSVWALKTTSETVSVGSRRPIIVRTASRNCLIFAPLIEPLRSRTRLKLSGRRAAGPAAPGRASK